MKLYIIIGALIAIGCFGMYEHHAGWVERDTEMQLEIASKNEEARKKEEELTAQLHSQSSKLQEANNAIDQKQTALDRAIRAGRVRFPSSGCVQTSASTAAPNGNRDDSASESDRQTLAAIAALVAEGDRNTEQLNACIAAYNQVMEKVNGQR
jgi:prophage endopeptidase